MQCNAAVSKTRQVRRHARERRVAPAISSRSGPFDMRAPPTRLITRYSIVIRGTSPCMDGLSMGLPRSVSRDHSGEGCTLKIHGPA